MSSESTKTFDWTPADIFEGKGYVQFIYFRRKIGAERISIQKVLR